jgi:hypothetical protein
LAITQIDYSHDDRFIEMAVQKTDKDNNIDLDSSDDIFVVWDITKNRLVGDYE